MSKKIYTNKYNTNNWLLALSEIKKHADSINPQNYVFALHWVVMDTQVDVTSTTLATRKHAYLF